MISTSITLPVSQGIPSGQPTLTRDQMWEGLLQKARDARLFLPPNVCTSCEVVAEGDNYIIRDAVILETDMQEFVSFEPKKKLTFHQIKGPWEGIIVNELLGDDKTGLDLRFYCLLSRKGVAPGGPEEQADQSMFEGDKGYRTALLASIAKTCELVASGAIVA